MKSAIQEDDAMDARALVLAGLDVDSRYDDSFTVQGYQIQTRSTLLHWAAAYAALECTKVRDATSTALHQFCHIKRLGVLRFSYVCLPLSNSRQAAYTASAVANVCIDFEDCC